MFDPAQTVPQDFEWTMPPCSHARMYAISFNLDLESLRTFYSSPLSQAYADIKRVLRTHGFKWQQRSVYFGDPEKVTAVTCVMAATELAQSFPWFAECVRDLRMLRVEEQSNLMPVVRQACERERAGLCLANSDSTPGRKLPSVRSDQIMEM